MINAFYTSTEHNKIVTFEPYSIYALISPLVRVVWQVGPVCGLLDRWWKLLNFVFSVGTIVTFMRIVSLKCVDIFWDHVKVQARF